MEKYEIKIKQIDITNDLFIIESTEGLIFESVIKKGSVNFKIFNEENHQVNLNNLESDQIVKIYGKKNPDQTNKVLKIKNSIIIKKIYIKNNYIFNSDSSEDINFFDEIN